LTGILYVHYWEEELARARKVTFSLQPELVEALDQAIRQGAAPSKNALVDRALRNELREVQREWDAAQWRLAAQDPLFLKDIEDVERAFRTADAETARGIE